MMLGAIAILGDALSTASLPLLGDRQAWWRAWIPSEAHDVGDRTVPVIAASLCVLLTVMTALALETTRIIPFAVYAAMMLLGERSLRPALDEIAQPNMLPVLAGPPEMRIWMPEEGWQYRLLPAGPAGMLPRRLPLTEGLNRIELWRAPDRRRTFLVWAKPGMELAAQLRDGADGPLLSGDRHAARSAD
jgi:hypothetical protein